MLLPNIDLAALNFFVHLYRTESLTQAARLSQITPSGASRMLSRLRALLDDPLFIRVGNVMKPTPRARIIYPELIELFSHFTKILSPPLSELNFHQKIFRIACYETNVLSILKTAVLQLIERNNQQMALDIRLVEGDFWKELETGALDFAILPVTGSRSNFHIARICPDSYVWVVDSSHPLVELQKKRVLISNDLKPYKIVKLQVLTHSSADDGSCLLLNEETPPNVMLRSPFVVTNLGLIRGTPLIAQVPLTVASVVSPLWDLQILGRPEHGIEHPLSVIWHQSKNKDLANQWLRSVIISSVKNLPSLEIAPLIKDH